MNRAETPMGTLMELTKRTEHPLQAMPGFDIRPYLPHAIAATLGVFGLPAAFVLGMIMLPSQDPSVIVTSSLSVGLSTVASIVGNSIWLRNPASTNVSFGDLMIWGWARRRHAERKLNRGTRMLGLDRRGQPTREQTEITRDKQLKVLHELNDALEAKDPYTRGHSERVERHVYRTAAAMGLSVHDLQELRMAAALHDIGKIRVPDRIIRKPGKLTDEERSIMEEHSAVGSWMLSHVASADVISAVRHHHERWDGKGYPDGLAGTDIPLYARIIAVCDTFDAITSTRPYRAKSDRQYAIDIIKAETGTQFDPMAVDVFLKSLPKKVPVTAMLLMLPGAGRVLKEFARALKRAGASSLAGATTAVSASVIIGAATVAPAIDRIPVHVSEPVAARSVSVPVVTQDSTTTLATGPTTPARVTRANASAKSRVATVDADLERETFDVAGAAEGTPAEPIVDSVLENVGDTAETVIEDVGGVGSDNGKADEEHGKSGAAPGRSDDEDKPGKGKDEDKPGKGNQDDGTTDPGNGNSEPGESGSDPGNGNGNTDPGPGNGGDHGNDGEHGNAGGNGNGNGGGNSDAGGGVGNGNGNAGSNGNSEGKGAPDGDPGNSDKAEASSD
jgi:hypothetical protein